METAETKVSVCLQREPEENPFVHTGKSLVCVVTPDGTVYGKKLDKNCRKNDVQLEIFYPDANACFVQWRDSQRYVLFRVLNKLDINPLMMGTRQLDLTGRQKEKIGKILYQSPQLNSLLNNIMFPAYCFNNLPARLYWPWDCGGKPFAIGFHDVSRYPNINVYPLLSHHDITTSSKRTVGVSYDQKSCTFNIVDVQNTYRMAGHMPSELPQKPNVDQFTAWVHNAGVTWPDHDADDTGFPHKKILAARAENGRFRLDHAHPQKRIRIMCGEHDLFEYLDIEEALLVCEEHWIMPQRHNDFWTLYVVQNNHLRTELPRILSNNKIRAQHYLDQVN